MNELKVDFPAAAELWRNNSYVEQVSAVRVGCAQSPIH